MGAELLLGVCDNINEIKMKVERYVSTQPCGLLVSSGARILQGEHRASPLPRRIRKPACKRASYDRVYKFVSIGKASKQKKEIYLPLKLIIRTYL